MSTLTHALGSANAAAPTIIAIVTSQTWRAPRAGTVIARLMGGGGGGGSASGGCATGGGSAAWAEKRWAVTEGQEFVFNIGAAGVAVAGAAGTDGGGTTVTSAGITVTAPGGKGGLSSAAAAALTNPEGSSPINADFGAAGVKSGDVTGAFTGYTGGAGVNLYAQPGNPTRSGNADANSTFTGGGSTRHRSQDSTSGATGGAGYLGPSVGTTQGPGLFSSTSPGASTDFYVTTGPWLILPLGPGNSNTTASAFAGGGNASASNLGQAGGAFSGGGAGTTSSTGGTGGYGAGGGAAGTGGKGGQGYAVIEFTPEE